MRKRRCGKWNRVGRQLCECGAGCRRGQPGPACSCLIALKNVPTRPRAFATNLPDIRFGQALGRSLWGEALGEMIQRFWSGPACVVRKSSRVGPPLPNGNSRKKQRRPCPMKTGIIGHGQNKRPQRCEFWGRCAGAGNKRFHAGDRAVFHCQRIRFDKATLSRFAQQDSHRFFASLRGAPHSDLPFQAIKSSAPISMGSKRQTFSGIQNPCSVGE